MNKTLRYIVIGFFAVACTLSFIFRPTVEVSVPDNSIRNTGKADTIPVLTIMFSGDFMQHSPQIQTARSGASFDYGPSLTAHSKLWKSADFAVLNFETTVSSDSIYSGYPLFSSPRELVYALSDAGITTLALANNHIMDKGGRGLRTTLKTIHSANLGTVGAYADSVSASKILYLERGPYKVALLNYTYSTNGNRVPSGMAVNYIDTTLMLRHLDSCTRDSATHVIAMMHWGVEYSRTPSKRQRELALWMRSHGVDVVVGSHPHVLQPIDTVLRVAYSLGNFVSNQQDPHTDYGATLRVTLDAQNNDIRLHAIPHWVDRADKYRVLLPSDTITCQKPQFYNALLNASQILNCDQFTIK